MQPPPPEAPPPAVAVLARPRKLQHPSKSGRNSPRLLYRLPLPIRFESSRGPSLSRRQGSNRPDAAPKPRKPAEAEVKPER